MKASSLEKYQAFFDMVNNLQVVYMTGTDAQKQLIETTIGAAIFYLPASKRVHFTGMISEGAVAALPKAPTKEHLYPRRVSARNLLSNPPATLEAMIEELNTKYMCYNLTTKEENKRLIPYQKVDTSVSPEDSYEKAGIVLKRVV